MNDIKTKLHHLPFIKLIVAAFTAVLLVTTVAAPVAAETCGSGENKVKTSVDVGCGVEQNPIYAYAKGIMRFLALGVGIVVVGAIVVGGIAYASARGDKGQVEKAKEIIRNAIIGLVLFILMAAIINFIIPGGLLS